MAVELDVVKKSGAWFSYKDERIGQGREAARNWLEANPKTLSEIEGRVRADLAKGAVAAGKKAAD